MNPDTTGSPFAEPPPPAPVPRRAPPPPRPSALAGIQWDDLRRKGWALALTLATAYVATKPERWGWIAPVLTAAAAGSKPPSIIRVAPTPERSDP